MHRSGTPQAADGTTDRPRTLVAVLAAAPRLTFHGLRHSYKTWMIADQIPEVAQARRLGHRIADKIQHVYSHVGPELKARLLDTLRQRWNTALSELSTPNWATAVAHHRALPAAPDRTAGADGEQYQSAS